MFLSILGQLGMISLSERLYKQGAWCFFEETLKTTLLCAETPRCFLLGQEHSHIISRWYPLQLCIQSCVSAAAHLKATLTCTPSCQT